MEAFIRRYQESDFDACAHICRATLPPSLSSSPVATKLSPYLWTHQYTFLSPSTCWVLDDGSGHAVGYCIGCPDVHAFASAYPSYVAEVLSPTVAAPPDLDTREPWSILDDSLLGLTAPGTAAPALGHKVNVVSMAQTAYNVRWLLFEGNEHLTDNWRATMHIDLLEPWQSKGWGRRLIASFVDSVRGSSQDYGQGIWIGIAAENERVVKFYERIGFRRIEKPDSGTGQGEDHGINMVKDLPNAG
ncbi:acetyltransferase [Pestalotiopsis sp. NC0098]|nr:acetyltransferase [Pestalotiopsis sp. NC0098]